MHYDLFGIGAALLDVECHVDDALLAKFGAAKGQMVLINHNMQQQLLDELSNQGLVYGEACGGAAANAVITASYFGSVTYFACRVSNDDTGKVFLRSLEQARVFHQTEGRSHGQLPTGRCLVLLTADAERTMQTALGANREICVEDVDADALGSSRHAFIEGYLAGSEGGLEAALYVRQQAARADIPVALSLSDVNIVRDHRSGLRQIIGADGIDVLFCNRAEALAWTGADSLEKTLPELGAMASCVVVTLGAEGALLWWEGEVTPIAPQPVVAVNTNGTGDAFAGTFLYSLLAGYTHQHAGRFANYVASNLAGRHGPRLTPEICDELDRSFPRHESS